MKYLLNGKDLNPQVLYQIAINPAVLIQLSQHSWFKVNKSRQVIQNILNCQEKVVYGVNTGFGNFSNKIIKHEDLKQLQINLIRSHSVGVGKPIYNHQVRMLQILRINTLAKGRSGISEPNLRKYIKACNSNFIPYIPEKGTVGASGDLAPLAHLTLGMIGQGKSWNQITKSYIDSKTVLQAKKLQPIELCEKQGLALINGTQFMTSITSEALIKAKRLLLCTQILIAFSFQIHSGDYKLINKKYIDILPNHSLKKTLTRLAEILGPKMSPLASKRYKQQKNSNSIFYAPDNLATVSENLELCQKLITEEINGSTDNPLVFTKQDGFEQQILLSAGNFHGEYIAKTADNIAMSIHTIGKFSERRIQRYVNGYISELPDFLCKVQSGINSGFMIAQYTSAALLSQNKVLAKPASIDSIPTSANQQDHVSMGGYASRKALELINNVSYILAIELLCACQTIDLLKQEPSPILSKIYKQVRKLIPFMEQDIYLGQYIQKAQNIIQQSLDEKGILKQNYFSS